MDKETIMIWVWRLALGAALVVGVLSWQTGVGFLQSVIRMIATYLLMYGLSRAAIYGFEKAAPPSEEIPEHHAGTGGNEDGRGVWLDVAVGQDDREPEEKLPEDEPSSAFSSESPRAGQVDAHLAAGMPDEEQQAEMVRRMGWGE